jgi:hypothetical protein
MWFLLTDRVIQIKKMYIRCITKLSPSVKVAPVRRRSRSLVIDGRCGVVVGILAYYARGCGFDSRTVQIFVCMNMSVCIGSGCLYV